MPVSIVANNPINPGDVLIVKSDGKVALKLSTDSNPITKVSTRLRLKKSGNISASIIRGDGSIDTIRKRVQVAIGAPSLKQSSNGFKKYKKKGKIKILFYNVMAADKYIKQINLSTNRGGVKIYMTPVLSKEPYLAIYGKYKFKTASIDVKLNNGSKYNTQNTIFKDSVEAVDSVSSNSCSKEYILKMLDDGYYQSEIDTICAK